MLSSLFAAITAKLTALAVAAAAVTGGLTVAAVAVASHHAVPQVTAAATASPSGVTGTVTGTVGNTGVTGTVTGTVGNTGVTGTVTGTVGDTGVTGTVTGTVGDTGVTGTVTGTVDAGVNHGNCVSFAAHEADSLGLSGSQKGKFVSMIARDGTALSAPVAAGGTPDAACQTSIDAAKAAALTVAPKGKAHAPVASVPTSTVTPTPTSTVITLSPAQPSHGGSSHGHK